MGDTPMKLAEATPGPAEGRIVVGVDGSAMSAKALRYGADLADLTGSMLQVVVVYNGLPGFGFTTCIDQDSAETLARDALNSVHASHPSVVTKGEIIYGVAGPSLCEVCEHAEVIVVGTRGRGRVACALLGSVSEYVMHHAPCTTIVVR